ncbi:MAG: ABC transporter permease subunit [Chloroflexota bacterium]|nr:ABC transporter permease subunit [Chloroflexota bacterium]
MVRLRDYWLPDHTTIPGGSVVERHTAVPFWRDVRVLTVVSQIVFVLLVALVATFLYSNLSSAMRQRGLVAGLDFLNRESGFDIGEGLISYASTDTYGRALVVGLLNTLLVSVVGIFFATILGVITGVARLSSNWLVNRIAAVYIEIIRNTPLLVQLVFIYFGIFVKLPPIRDTLEFAGAFYANQRGVFLPRPVPSPSFDGWAMFIAIGLVAAIVLWVGLSRHPKTRVTLYPLIAPIVAFILIPAVGWFLIGPSPLGFEVPERGKFNFTGGLALSPEFSALLFGLVIYTAAFIAEVVRGGLQAVQRGQIEAARAIGLNEIQILQLIVFPQALRVIVPPLTSQYLNLAKNSSLAIAIGYPDLFNVGATTMNQTGQPVPVIILVMAIYLAISLFTSLLMNIYNSRIQILEK